MEHLAHYQKEERPWGNFERFTLNEKTTVKILTLKPDASLSLQSHKHRSEFWHILSGKGFITLDQNRREAHPGENFFSPVGHEHRIESNSGGITFLEIAFGEFAEDDETRLEDRYGRNTPRDA